MKKQWWLLLPVVVIGIAGVIWAYRRYVPAPLDPSAQLPADEQLPDPMQQEPSDTLPASANLTMAYINEAPDNDWTGSWKNGCEEAAITMVEKYYLGEREVTTAEAKAFMQTLFAAQQAKYGSDANADAAQILWMIDEYTSFHGTIVDNPTVEQIKREIAAGRPVIALHYGFALGNKNIPFLPTGSRITLPW